MHNCHRHCHRNTRSVDEFEHMLATRSYHQALYDLWKKGKLQKLTRLCDSILNRYPNDIDALKYKAFIAYEEKKFPLCMKLVIKGLKVDPENIPLLKLKAKLHKKNKQVEKELECYEKILLIKPDVETLFLKAELMEKEELYDQALDCIDKALKFDPHSDVLIEKRVKLLEKLGRLEDLLDYYNKLLKSDPTNIGILRLKGNVLKKLGRFRESIETYKRVQDPVWAVCYTGETYEVMDNQLEALSCFNKAINKFELCFFAKIKKIRVHLEMGELDTVKQLLQKTKDELEEFDKNNPTDEDDDESDNEIQFATSILELCEKYLKSIENLDPDENVYNLLKRHEEIEFLKENLDQVSLCLDPYLEHSTKEANMTLTQIKMNQCSKKTEFPIKKILDTPDKDAKIEKYKNTLIRCFLKLFRSIKFANLNIFCEEKEISHVEMDYVYLPWRTSPFSEKKILNFFEWGHFRNFINRIHDKYQSFFSSNIFNDISEILTMIKTNMPFRARIRQANKNILLQKFKEDDIQNKVVELFKNHWVQNFDDDIDLLAFVDFELFKEILLKSSFPLKFGIIVKLRNITHYLIYPSHIEDFGGIVILRNPDDIGKDEEEFQIILKKETLRIKGLAYMSNKVEDTKIKFKDVMDITLDLFIWDNFKMVFTGISSEKKTEFRIPSYNYQFMINVRVLEPSGNLHRKALFDCKFLHRKETNFADVRKEIKSELIRYKKNNYDHKRIHTERTGKLGIYIV